MFTGTVDSVGEIHDFLQTVDQAELFRKYLGIDIDLNKKYKSPFRLDKYPGCRLNWHRGILRLIDNARYKGRLSWDIVAIVAELKQITFGEAATLIRDENPELLNYSDVYHHTEKERPNIKFTYIPFPEDNIFFLPNEILNDEGVYLVKDYWTGRKDTFQKNSIHNPAINLCIAYYFPDSNHTKLYFPEKDRNDFKWYSNCDINDIFGKYKLDFYANQTDSIIITKSQKDRLVLDYHLGYASIAVQNEGSIIPEVYINYLEEHFKNIYILFDNDDTGRTASLKIQSLFKNAEILQLEEEYKDVYDKYIKFGSNFKI